MGREVRFLRTMSARKCGMLHGRRAAAAVLQRGISRRGERENKNRKGIWMMRKMLAFLLAAMLPVLCACTGPDAGVQNNGSQPGQTDSSDGGDAGVQYDYPLKAGEPVEVYDMTFDQMVTVTVDPASTRDGDNESRSYIYFDNCVFNDGLTIVGDYHAVIALGAGCTFGDGSVVTCREATPGAARDVVLEDNIVKLFLACEGVAVETDAAVGVWSDGPDVALNGTTYSKEALTPDTDFLGVYALYEGGTLTVTQLGINEDDSVVYLD